MLTDNPNFVILVKKLELIPGVVQVRFWLALRQKIKNLAGGDCVNFVLIVKNFNNMPDDYEGLKSLVPLSVINDLSLHDQLVSNLTELLNGYVQTGIIPTRLAEAVPPNPIENLVTTASILESYIPEPITPTIEESPPTP